MYVCFLLTLQLLSFPMQTGLIGLKAEAIGKKKWGIATDRFKKIKKSAHCSGSSAVCTLTLLAQVPVC